MVFYIWKITFIYWFKKKGICSIKGLIRLLLLEASLIEYLEQNMCINLPLKYVMNRDTVLCGDIT